MGIRVFPSEVLAFFEANNHGRTAQEMVNLLNGTFGTSYTVQQIKGCRARHHWNSGLTGQFSPGHTPHNKGKKGHNYAGMEATKFKPGHTPHNHRSVGSERVNRDGYRERKVAEPKKWKMVHVLNWEAAHGPVPRGSVLIFKDGDKNNCDVSNLLLITRGELAVMNKRGLCTQNAEATEAGLLLANYIRAATARKKRRPKHG